jgi:site-specific recombinase XerD
MTRLRKMMLEELQRRNFAESTTEAYIRAVKKFSQYFNSSPDHLGPRHIREYQASLFQKRKFSPNTVAQHLAALRFFYIKTLKKAWSITETPYPKRAVRLPTILSQEEVTRLIDAAHPPLHALDEQQQKVAIVDPNAYADILTAASRKAALQGQASLRFQDEQQPIRRADGPYGRICAQPMNWPKAEECR